MACDWAPETTPAFGDSCDTSADCAADVGLCYFGHCTNYQCTDTDFVCPSGAICGGFCLDGCNTTADCVDGHTCNPTDGVPGGFAGLCVGVCIESAECNTGDLCRKTTACS